MMWYYGQGGGGGIWMAAAMVGFLLFSGGVIALVIWAIRGAGNPTQRADPAIEVLRRRLAAGEITPEEFERTKKGLGA